MSTSYFYDAQFKNVLSQFTRVFHNFRYMTGLNGSGKKELLPIPVYTGSQSRLVSVITNRNSENIMRAAPCISCSISNINYSRGKVKSPTYVDHLAVNERRYNYEAQKYENEPGSKYHVERLAPIPYDVTLQADILTTNEDMKFQILEQIFLIFNPAIDFQKNENPLDWTSKLSLELENVQYTARQIPIGTGDDTFDISTLTFRLDQFYLNPPAKVKKQFTIQNIITTLGDPVEYNEWGDMMVEGDHHVTTMITTYKGLELLVTGDELEIVSFDNDVTWLDYFEKVSLKFEPDVYFIRLRQSHFVGDSSADVLVRINSISQIDPKKATVTLMPNTLRSPSLPPVDDFINPNVTYPDHGLASGPLSIGKRYIITKNIVPDTQAWGVLSATSGSVITSNDGVNWIVDFDSSTEDVGNIVRNVADNELYIQVTEDVWQHLYFGQYKAGFWRLVSIVNNKLGN